MKKIVAVVGSLLLVVGVRAQTVPQTKKETKKPAATNSLRVKGAPVSPAPTQFYKKPATVRPQNFTKKPIIKH
jgi:hypothetical protein